MSEELTHFNTSGEPRMVDIGDKEVTSRTAIAQGCVWASPQTIEKIDKKCMKKGDPYDVARIAGIMAAKRTFELIPMCHPIGIDGVDISVNVDMSKPGMAKVIFKTELSCTGKTGIEMEALTAASVAALTFYDMCKSVDRGMVIGDICLLEKRGGKSGVWKKE